MAEKANETLWLQQVYMEYLKLPVESHCILVETMQRREMGLSMQVLAKTLGSMPEFSGYQIYVVCTPEALQARNDFFDWIGVPSLQLVLFGTEDYNRLLATAGILINERSFPNYFIKREEQTYLRIWNETPLQKKGRYSETEYATMGNFQRNLWCADYLICPDEFTKDYLADAYMLGNLAKNKVLYAGRFQNALLFDEALAAENRKKYALEGKQVFLYAAASWEEKGSAECLARENAFWETLSGLDKSLSDTQLLVVSAPYYLLEEYPYAALQHIRFLPRSLSAPAAMALADCLITDGSDWIFDFAATRKKIILYSGGYAKPEEYYQLHGELPFVNAGSLEELVQEMNREKQLDDEKFFKTYSSYNRPDMAEAVLRHTILKEQTELLETKFPDNGKPNILLYPGPLFKNGITSALLSLLRYVDRKKYNYMLFFRTEQVRANAETLQLFPEEVAYYGYSNVEGVCGEEKEIFTGWQQEPDYPYEKAKPVIYSRMQNEKKRLLSFLRIDMVIHYEGYGRDILPLFEVMPCRRMIYLHNNMLLEIEKKGIRPEPLRQAYNAYDVVALVSEEQRTVAEQMIADGGGNPAQKKIVLAKNIIPYEQIADRAKQPFCLDKQTRLNVSEERLDKVLHSEKKKFVTIGRFLPEKGHARLISAFEQVHGEHPDTSLIILGGYGPLYEETIQLAGQSLAADDIVVIQYLSNPYALLDLCDYFVLSSYYEGLPLVLTEADIAGLPCISTDIPGPHELFGKHGGMLVENSETGLVKGMLACLEQQVPERLTIDYAEYNKEAVNQFETVLPER